MTKGQSMSNYEGTFEVRLHHATSNKDGGFWELEISDPKSLHGVFSARLSTEDFAALVGTSEYQRKVIGTLFTGNADKWGLNHENQTVVVPTLNRETWDDRHKIISDFLAANGYAKDGWVHGENIDGDGTTASTGFNGHKFNRDKGYSIIIRRWVADEWTEMEVGS